MSAPNPKKHNARRQPGEVGKAKKTSQRSLHPNSGEAQRRRVMQRLRRGPATTIQLRREEDVMMPAARVHELRRKQGEQIDLVWVEQATDCGRVHRVGQYVLRRGATSLRDARCATEARDVGR